MANERSKAVDVTKGIGIILVVVAHVERGLGNSGILSAQGIVSAADRFIYAFHMPLFFVMAGLFLPRAAERPLGTFLKDRILRSGYPYVVWVTIQSAIQILLSRHTNNPMHLSDLIAAAYAGPMQFWFIYALLVQSILFGVIWKLKVGRGGFFVITAVLWALAPWTPDPHFVPALQAREYLPYLAVGVLLGEPSIFERLSNGLARVAGPVIVGGYLTVFAVVRWGPPEIRVLPILAGLAGTLATLSLSIVLTRRGRGAHLAMLGQASLAIYCVHTIASAGIRIALQKVLRTDNAAIHFLMGTLAGLYLPLGLIWLSRRTPFPDLFELPRRRDASLRVAPAG